MSQLLFESFKQQYYIIYKHLRMGIIIKYNETICIRTNFIKCLSRQLTYIKVKCIFAKLIPFFNNELHEYQIQNKIPLKCTN